MIAVSLARLHFSDIACQDLLFPVLTVKKIPVNFKIARIVSLAIYTVECNSKATWIRSWLVKSLNPTNGAKLMTSHFCAELVERNMFFTLQELKILAWDHKVVILFHMTDGAVAFVDANFFRSIETEPNSATVTATVHRSLHSK